MKFSTSKGDWFAFLRLSGSVRSSLIHRFIPLAIVSLLVVVMASCLKEPLPPLRVGYSVWPGYESLYLARDLGYYNNSSIRLVDYPSNAEIIRAFRNGDLDAAAITLYEALVIAETHPNIRIILKLDSSYGGDVILAKPEIKTLQALKNRRVGVEVGTLAAFVLTRALETVAMTPKAVRVIPVGLTEHEQAFNRGKIDAIVTFEPVRSKLLAHAAHLLFDSTQIPGEILDVLAVREDLLDKQATNLQALIQGHFRALRYLAKNPQDAAQRIALRENVTPNQFLESLKRLQIPLLSENQRFLSNGDRSAIERLNRVAQFMADTNLLSRLIRPNTLFDDRFVRRIQPSAIEP